MLRFRSNDRGHRLECWRRRAQIICALLALATTPTAAQNCGDCNGDLAVSILDALVAAQHAAALSTLVSPFYEQCNVNGALGGPGGPGMPTVDILDALTLARFAAALIPAPTCVLPPIISPGPFDLFFTQAPTEIASNQQFQMTVALYVQGTAQPAIPQVPILIEVLVATGTGALRGSTKQWVATATHEFGNLFYGPTSSVFLRATAGAPHGDAFTASIPCVTAVNADLRGRVETAPGPYTARFYFRADGRNVPFSGTLDYTIIRESTGATVAAASLPAAAVNRLDIPVPVLPGPGLYTVHASIAGSVARSHMTLHLGSTAASFVATLASGRVGVPYSAAITGTITGTYTGFFANPTELPPGLTLAPGPAGTITGTPTRPGYYSASVYGVNAAGLVTRVPLAIAVFSWRDTEVESGIDFSAMGPHPVSFYDFPSASTDYSFTNSWTCVVGDTTRVRIYHPTSIATLPRLPAIAFIHGNGFDWDDYDEIMTVVASYGYIIGSCNNPGYPGSVCTLCGGGGGGGYGGFARATGFQNSVYEKFLQFDADPASPIYQHVDADNIVWSGHSRGGSTTLLNIIFAPHKVRGAIPIMAVEPQAESCLVPTYLANSFPPVPVLSFSAERDADVIFPYAENPMEDAVRSGMDTHVTVYGANHNNTGDTNPPDGSPTITRTEQHQRIRHWFGVFMARHTKGDLRLEGQLYLDEHTSSTNFAVFGPRNMEGTVLLDDHQTSGAATNTLTGPNTTVTISPTELDTHPSGYSYNRTVIHRRLGFGSGAGANTWAAPAGVPANTNGLERLAFRARQFDSTSPGGVGSGNWQSWLASYSVTLTDGAGQMATVDIRPRLPVSGTPSPSQQRFHRFSLRFDEFVAANPSFNPVSIQSVRFNLGPAGSSSRFVAIDDVLFE